MELSQFLNHPLFKKSIRNAVAGEILFHQGEVGNTMFIILEGKVRLLSETQGRQYTIAIMGQGQFLGEKAIVKDEPYQRHFTAQAVTPLIVLELGASELIDVQKQSPYLMKLILTRSFEMAEERLDRANYLVRVLRSSDNRVRINNLVGYLAKSIGRREPDGIRIPSLVEHIYFHIDMEKKTIEKELNRLATRGLIQKRDGDYIVPSIDVLAAALESHPSTEKTAA